MVMKYQTMSEISAGGPVLWYPYFCWNGVSTGASDKCLEYNPSCTPKMSIFVALDGKYSDLLGSTRVLCKEDGVSRWRAFGLA